MHQLEVISLNMDEWEALRLADYEGLYQADAAGKMGISRATFSGIVASARKKTALALLQGLALKINGDTCPEEEG